jgi:hypothetical protein
MKRTADSSTTSEAYPKSTSHGRRASGIAFGSIHTAITPSTPRRYGNGGSCQSNKGSKERKTWASRYQLCCLSTFVGEEPLCCNQGCSRHLLGSVSSLSDTDGRKQVCSKGIPSGKSKSAAFSSLFRLLVLTALKPLPCG